MRKHLKRKKRLTMKNVKSMIKPGMLINTANYVFATIIHPITGKLIAFPICGGPTLPIDESYDNDGNCIMCDGDFSWLNILGLYEFAEGCDCEFDDLVFDSSHREPDINKTLNEYIEEKIVKHIA